MKLQSGIWMLLALQGCGGDQTHTITFAATAGARPFDCGTAFDGIGTTQTAVEPLDFRIYVHDVTLVRSGGGRVPLALVPDGKWQSDRVALLDFEDGSGTCKTGSLDVNGKVVGIAPAHQDYVAVEFKVGVPDDLNHLDAPTAEPPLNLPGMWWSWAGGYRFIKLDVKSRKNEEWFFHLGSTECEGKTASGYQCKFGNQVSVRLDGFDPARNRVVLDVEALYASSDLDAQVDMVTDFLPGCMAFSGDPECQPLFDQMGMIFESPAPGPTQRFFKVQ